MNPINSQFYKFQRDIINENQVILQILKTNDTKENVDFNYYDITLDDHNTTDENDNKNNINLDSNNNNATTDRDKDNNLAIDNSNDNSTRDSTIISNSADIVDSKKRLIRLEIPKSYIGSVEIEKYLTELANELRLTSTEANIKENTELAFELYTLASLSNKNYAPAYFYMGVIYSEKREITMSLQSYQKAVDINPFYPEALCNIGVIYKSLGDLDSSIRYYYRALQGNPNYQLVRSNLAIALNDYGTKVKLMGDLKKSIQIYKKSLSFNYKHSETYYNLGVVYAENRKFEQAIYNYELAIHFNPSYTEALNNLGVIFKESDNLERALQYYNQALISRLNFPQSLNNIGVIYTMNGKMKLAKEHLKNAIKHCPDYAEAYNNMGVIYRDIGKIEKSIQSYESCVKLSPSTMNAPQNKLLALNYSTVYSLEEVYSEHKKWGDKNLMNFQKCSAVDNLPVSSSNLKHKRILTIGYLSADFFVHSVSYFIDGILRNHNRDGGFRIIIYSNVCKEDSTTERIKGYSAIALWRNIVGMSAIDVSEMIKSDQVDILVELSGHTCGNRLDVVLHSPAPLIATYIGYPNTTGLENVNYKFTDLYADPSDTKQKYTETLWRLPNSFLTYSPPVGYHLNDIPPAPFLKNGYITFGTFNILAKYSDQCLHAWSKILQRMGNSKCRLLLKSKPFACEKTCKSFKKRLLETFKINPDQVDLIGLFPQQKDHLQYYSHLDISLDTFPYSGTTTTCESLLMGVPVVTLSGSQHSHNVGKSILSNIGLPELIANNNVDQYIDIAVQLANNTSKLIEYRSSLRSKMISSYLCDNAQFTKNLESAYKSMWSHFIDTK
ncbi:glycosyltransferase [Tieghemostelium lacteum]|uniref:Probable UDP-N-acetylglucosamine--peptide N-acetylglucosaminyltransferase SPINDLY n=1 Tax=Tieghemostelium lacteum TaxID=361077 RepID=A0A152A921_TIELA|nr:glycosyltransferase [Tieghemostelium lacteum]|eukprot:KYR02718.1 glycosyltransferase [Tieghemostelium lacteum]